MKKIQCTVHILVFEYNFSRYQNLKCSGASLSSRYVIYMNTEPRSKQIKKHTNMQPLKNLHLCKKLHAIRKVDSGIAY